MVVKSNTILTNNKGIVVLKYQYYHLYHLVLIPIMLMLVT